MWSYLTFERLISIDVLIVFYYFGAVVMPVFMLWFMLWLKTWLLNKSPTLETSVQKGGQLIKTRITRQSRFKWSGLFVVAFLFAELFWRLLFEFLIAYMQMRDAIVMSY